MANGLRRLGLVTLMAALPAFMVTPTPARAQGALICSAANLGQSVCQPQGVCKCVLSEGGTLTGEAAGYQWRCDLLYGNCAAGVGAPLLSTAVTPAVGAEAGDPERVRAAQAALTKRGFNTGGVDGVIGPRTRAAIEAFQRDRSLPPTGALSPQTMAALGL